MDELKRKFSENMALIEQIARNSHVEYVKSLPKELKLDFGCILIHG